MSAIWGIIDKEKNISDEKIKKMQDSMQEFQIDRLESIAYNQVYFACGHQYFTKESKEDISPVYDEKRHIWYTGDCFLYNRQEVMELILEEKKDCKPKELLHMGDAYLAYQWYLCKGEKFVSDLRGVFSFVFYDEDAEQILLYTDHVAQRYLAYYYGEKKVIFSTVYQSLIQAMDKQSIELCDEWIMAAYTDCSADTLRFPQKTVWKDVYQVEPGTYVKINLKLHTKEIIVYWNPLKNMKKKKKLEDEIYKKQFLTLFEQTTQKMLRAKENTGIMLSGGLDSSSVGAMAAKELEKEKKKLYSYTAVPVSEYPFLNDKYSIENEKELIYKQKRLYPNIEPKFIDVAQANCFTNLEQYVNMYMQPVKPALNMINVEGMYVAAAKDNCSILLSGQNGNSTISYGNLLTYVHQKCTKGHWRAAYKEIKAFGRLRRIGRKRIFWVYLKTFIKLRFQTVHFGKDCLLKECDIKKYKLLKVEKTLRKERGNGILDTRKQQKGFTFMPLVYQHMGFYNTYSSLKYGVLSLDPTLTKDMIEFCLQLPMECYVHNGKERRLIRDYMEGLVPKEILENHTGRGIQAADFAYRVNRDWNSIKEQVNDILQEPLLMKYLDEEKLNALRNEVKEKEYHMDRNLVARITIIASLGYFLRTADSK